MRKNAIAVVTGVSTVVLGAGWAAGLITAANNAPASLPVADPAPQGNTGATTSPAVPTQGTASDSTQTPAAAATDQASSQATASAPVGSPAPQTPEPVSGVFDGAAVDTRYGPYQAEIVIDAGVITDVKILQQGDGDRETRKINERAIPTLVERVLSAQSWNVEGVSGASYTSPALLTSVKDALSQAGLA